MRDRERHEFIVARIEERLDGRSWRWLAKKAGIPQSTLATQKQRWFTEPVLYRIATALGITVGDLFPPRGSRHVAKRRVASPGD